MNIKKTAAKPVDPCRLQNLPVQDPVWQIQNIFRVAAATIKPAGQIDLFRLDSRPAALQYIPTEILEAVVRKGLPG
ncbi:MAG: hypothetical protein K8R25_02905 [Methanosarcinales archaeon]|nr:hypothetical protein [Methanosarcinales archaeon]